MAAARLPLRAPTCAALGAALVPLLLAPLLLAPLLIGACGVAPVRHDGSVAPPPTWQYAGRHGRPLAFGGNVCEDRRPHAHVYPPSPRAAFAATDAGLVDRRRMWSYFDNHRHRGRTCFRDGWHLHLEPPDAELRFDDAHNAWRAPP